MAELNNNSISKKIINYLIAVIAIGLPLFHMWTASFGVYPSHVLSGIHWAFIGSFIIITKPLKGGICGKIIDGILFVINIFISIYQIFLQNTFVQNAGIYSQTDIYISIISLIVILLIASRVVGRILPIIAIYLLYMLYVEDTYLVCLEQQGLLFLE